MRWMIASDIHGSAYYCREMLEAFSREKADRLLLLGDILATRRWIRWFWSFPSWRITVF